MRSAFRRIGTLLLCIAMVLSMVPTLELPTDAASTAYYNEYYTVQFNYDYGSCGSMQGLAVGSSYLYTVKINGSNTSAVMYMTHKDTEVTTQLINGSTGGYYFYNLGHANDMDVWGIDNASHIFVTSADDADDDIVRFKRSGSTLTQVGTYNLTYNGNEIGASGLSIKGVSNGIITFYVKWSQVIYMGTMSTDATSGTIAVTKVCSLNKSKAYINGTQTDMSSYVNQGMDYYDGKLYVPYSGDDSNLNRSVILCYDIENASGGTVYPDKYLSFRISSSAYSALFEIESCGICGADGKLYFNTNRRVSSSSTNHDGVHYFENYTYTDFHNVHVWSNGVCKTCGTRCSHSWSSGKCSTCGLSCTHSWSSGKCSTCGLTCSHSWSNGTCKTCGLTCTHTWSNGTCSTCGSACVHSWDNDGSWTVTKQADCTTDGAKQRTCPLCNVTQTETIAATGHSYTATEYSGTCLDRSHTEYICGSCGDSYKEYAMSAWSTTKPTGVDESLIESKTQYRYSDYETKTSYETSMDGYTLKDSQWVSDGTTSVYYVKEWPDGFLTTNSHYASNNNIDKKVTPSETDTTKIVVESDAFEGWVWYHWCHTDSYYSVASKSGDYDTFHAFYYIYDYSTNYDSSDGSYEFDKDSCCTNSDWYWRVEVYCQKYTNYKKQFTYERWTDYTAWSDTAATASSTRKVETRTVYRYVTSELGDHVWNDGACTVCSAACDHNWVESVCGTCGKNCVHSWSDGQCSVCGTACAHTWSNGSCATCGKACAHTWSNGTCTTCGIACAHNWNDGVCGTCGIACAHNWSDGTCSTCGKVCAHSWSNGTCTTCGKVCAHSWNDGTCTTCGKACSHAYENGSCTVCGTVCVHSWESGTCTVCGLVCDHSAGGSVCPTCGETLLNPTITPVSPSLSLEEEVHYQIYYTITDLGNVTVADMGLLYWSAPRSEGTIDDADHVVPGAVQSGSYYIVRSEGIAAKELADSLYFKIYAKLEDGSYVYSSMFRFNAKTYAEAILKSNAATDLKQTCVALLNYGASAQTYFGYKAYALMNAGLTEEQQALISDYSASMVEGITKVDASKVGSFARVSGGFSGILPSVTLGGAFSVNFYFVPAKTVEGKMTLYCWDLETYNSVGVLTPENALDSEVMEVNEAGQYVGAFENIAAKDMGQTVFVAAVYESGGVRYCSGVLACSVSAVAASQMSGGTESLQALTQELLVYGYYAKAYFAV